MTALEALKEVEESLASIEHTVKNLQDLHAACKTLGFEKLATTISIHVNDLFRERTSIKNALIALNSTLRKN